VLLVVNKRIEMKIYKGLLVLVLLIGVSFSMQGQQEAAMSEVLKTLTLEQKIKILEYAKNLEKEIDAEILKKMKKLSNDNQGKLIEYAQSVSNDVSSKIRVPEIAQPDVQVAALTTVEFDKMSHNFGKVKEGEIVEFEYRFKNTGSEPYVIQNAKGSCGCTVPVWPKKPILPGESGTVKVRFDTNHKPGNRTQTVYISSNLESAILSLKLIGVVEESH
jgi:hypothetical protein